MRHFVIVGILVIVATILTYVGLTSIDLLPVSASLQAGSISDVGSIDWLWNWEVVVMCFLFSLIIVPMFYSLVVFRRRKGDTSDGEHFEGNTTLEIAWTVLPLILVFAFAYMGALSLADVRRVDPNARSIKVQARQFSWTFEYPEYGFFSNELHLPVDQQVVLKMTSSDVIHSFWVPEFRVKQDVVPGRTTDYIVTPTLEGSYKVRCAELCGTSHYNMQNAVIVESQESFDAWVAEQMAIAAEAALTPEGQGQLLSVKNGCVGCHSVDGSSGVGPTWFGLYGSEVHLADGSTIIADDAFITESILDPKAKEVAGFSPTTMPAFELTDEEIANIIAYIKTLR
jgi:cytochrome c oxidase subunit II